MKKAHAFLEEFLKAVQPHRRQAISLTESEPKDEKDTNWTTGLGVVGLPVLSRYNDALREFRKAYPRIDWSEVESRPGERKRVARSYSEVAGA